MAKCKLLQYVDRLYEDTNEGEGKLFQKWIRMREGSLCNIAAKYFKEQVAFYEASLDQDPDFMKMSEYEQHLFFLDKAIHSK